MCDEKSISVACGITEWYKVNIAIYDNKYNDNNVMCASMWYEFFGSLVQRQNPWYMEG